MPSCPVSTCLGRSVNSGPFERPPFEQQQRSNVVVCTPDPTTVTAQRSRQDDCKGSALLFDTDPGSIAGPALLLTSGAGGRR